MRLQREYVEGLEAKEKEIKNLQAKLDMLTITAEERIHTTKDSSKEMGD